MTTFGNTTIDSRAVNIGDPCEIPGDAGDFRELFPKCGDLAGHQPPNSPRIARGISCAKFFRFGITKKIGGALLWLTATLPTPRVCSDRRRRA